MALEKLSDVSSCICNSVISLFPFAINLLGRILNHSIHNKNTDSISSMHGKIITPDIMPNININQFVSFFIALNPYNEILIPLFMHTTLVDFNFLLISFSKSSLKSERAFLSECTK